MSTKKELLEQLRKINQKEEKDFIEEIDQMIDLIVEKRKSLELSQTDISIITGISQTTISRIETKTNIPTLNILYKICKSLDLTIKIVDIK